MFYDFIPWVGMRSRLSCDAPAPVFDTSNDDSGYDPIEFDFYSLLATGKSRLGFDCSGVLFIIIHWIFWKKMDPMDGIFLAINDGGLVSLSI